MVYFTACESSIIERNFLLHVSSDPLQSERYPSNTIPFHPNPHPPIPPEPIHLQDHLPPFDPDWRRPKDTEQTYCSDSVVCIYSHYRRNEQITSMT